MSRKLFELAQAGDVDAVCDAAAESCAEGEREESVYQWLQVAASLGSDEAEEMADSLYDAVLSRGGDETVAVLHFEVAQWFICGEQEVEPNPGLGLYQLERAEQLRLRESVQIDGPLRDLRARLDEAGQERFDGIFPGLV